jgi:hypothetical protein
MPQKTRHGTTMPINGPIRGPNLSFARKPARLHRHHPPLHHRKTSGPTIRIYGKTPAEQKTNNLLTTMLLFCSLHASVFLNESLWPFKENTLWLQPPPAKNRV